MKELHKRSRNPKFKKKYRVTNWKEYESSLRNRGSLTLWISPSVIRTWKAKPSKSRGRQHQFSDRAIETILSLRLVFHLPLRQTEGFIASIFQMMKLSLPAPDHTTLSWRGRTLRPGISVQQQTNQQLHPIVDSTGLSIHGEEPWSSGKKRTRRWRKHHISIDSEGHIRSSCVSKWYIKDGSKVNPILQDIKEPIASLQLTEAMTKNLSIELWGRRVKRLRRSFIHAQMLCCLVEPKGQICAEDTWWRCPSVEMGIGVPSTEQSGECVLSVQDHHWEEIES